MTTLKNDRFLRALLREPVDTTPVWMMRQAGRYLPEYRETRAQAGDFLSLCKNTDFACEVTLQPLRRYELDAAILFSDILTVPDALGLGLYFETGEGPKFHKTVRTAQDVANLPKLNAKSDLAYVMNAVSTIRSALNGQVPLIGFSGSPWTLATYMVEGGSSKEFRFIKNMMYAQPEVLHALLDHLADSVIDYLNAQIDAGAQAIQIFDSWGGALAHREYVEFSLNYMTKIIAGLQREKDGQRIPIILFTKGGGQWLETMLTTGADAFGLDWTTPLYTARDVVAGRAALQGNLDPAVLYGSAASIEKSVKAMLDDAYASGEKTGYIANLGHGITQWVDPAQPKIFVDTVHEYSAKYLG
ncbi:uroporphyrinogen decarboxylase [Acinetobacter gyllenbergii]|uniref:Uroporphyrinogen decarboxylase n=1 Tax=Acinetobacter gyllenbergii CIP 110306 = MTCC 11365 TaxID=1217657 RepID=A0A829HG87_9GAMM|nr:uroporphyrinogen decarboxylase [Acinetobacter gyllenbergii]EPF80310.1 uroporphyrinogen decarboxylase [Acinetobacter gyllenbergii CIP 110306 = MTCC 11365]EPH35065.1 Uroporphyrinogen III decarboxylase [Acinetobacter gyllenbergii CIP 110306 = MTCC 11365]ESK53182.1 uroporphyrinogen decarboxylase [Acinetobacter gyllenbergii NIPH 230]OBY75034.1 uroporphyrinogen decarboxylase [Acinetobacter gyllenbergii]GMA13432.1 uroporphyrinogen decarboxylase [Acinetobacter gyllenbergii]